MIYVDAFESSDKLPRVTLGLLERGWSSTQVSRVLGENWMRVFRAAWG